MSCSARMQRKIAGLVIFATCLTIDGYVFDKKYLAPALVTQVFAAQSSNDSFAVLNAKIYTVNETQPWAQAMLVDQGEIVAIGSDKQILLAANKNIDVIDLGGRFIMPGFQDAHLHVAEAGFNEIMCLFSETLDAIVDYEEELAACAQEPEGEDAAWILGAGISVSDMLEDTSTTPLDFLDDMFPNTPVLILDNVGHGAWVNSAAMAEVGYSVDNPLQPQGGVILTKGSATKRATGVIFENAQQVFRDAAFKAVDPDQSLGYQGLLNGLKELSKNGITSVSDAGGYWTRNDHLLWMKAMQEGKMTVRANNALYVFPDRELASQIEDIKKLYKSSASELLKFNTVKIYIDGILALGTSALKQPYAETVVAELNFPKGFEYFDPAELLEYAIEFDKAGFQLHFHATGDRGVAIALNAIEYAQTQNKTSSRSHRITHAYLIDEPDRERFRQLGVVADFQLNPSSLDTEGYIPFLQEILGKSRASDLLPVRGMHDADVRTILSSDYDAGPLSPLGTIERALNRPDGSRKNLDDIDSAIYMVTLGTAEAFNAEENTGSLEVGKQADFVVLDKDITTIPISDIGSTAVLSTVVGGEVVFDLQGLFQ